MVTTKHFCWGKCKLDSRYPDELLKSLRELKESGRKKSSFRFENLRKTSKSVSVGWWLVTAGLRFSQLVALRRHFSFGHAHSSLIT